MPDQDARHSLRERSRALFGGAQYRLEIGAAIADGDGIVCIKDLAYELGDPPGTGSVNTELKVLERAGLLARVDRERGERRVYLVRQESVYWAFCQEARTGCDPGSEVGGNMGATPPPESGRSRDPP